MAPVLFFAYNQEAQRSRRNKRLHRKDKKASPQRTRRDTKEQEHSPQNKKGIQTRRLTARSEFPARFVANLRDKGSFGFGQKPFAQDKKSYFVSGISSDEIVLFGLTMLSQDCQVFACHESVKSLPDFLTSPVPSSLNWD